MWYRLVRQSADNCQVTRWRTLGNWDRLLLADHWTKVMRYIGSISILFASIPFHQREGTTNARGPIR